jgi:GAF domain-containing protein
MSAPRARRPSGRGGGPASCLRLARCSLPALDYEETLANVARLAVPELADWCAVATVEEDGSIRQLALAPVDADKEALGREWARGYPTDPDAPSGVAAVIRTGRPELITDITDAMLEAAHDEGHLPLLRGLALSSAIVVPLRARGRTLGALTLVRSGSSERYDEDDLSLAQQLADRCGLAVDNARLHGGEARARGGRGGG